MLSLTSANTWIPESRCYSSSRLSGPLLVSSLIFDHNPWRKSKIYTSSVILSCQNFGFTESRKCLDGDWCCWCRRDGGEECDIELEAQIMEFMAKSEKPTMFPTKKELIGTGRLDLVEAIEKRDGWYSLGWVDEDLKCQVEEAVDIDIDIDIGEFNRRVEKFKQTASLGEHSTNSFSGVYSEANSNSGDVDFSQLNASPSLENSIEMGAEEDSGIEGILSRLERQRKSDLGFNLKNGHDAHAGSKDSIIARNDLEGNGRLGPNLEQMGLSDTSCNCITRINEPETWRTWSNQRAGFEHTNFEASEISFSKDLTETDEASYHGGMLIKTEKYGEGLYNYEQTNHTQIRTRLQQLESELNTALYSLRSKRDKDISEVTGSSSDLQDLSDAWEFQENEFMSAKERLRSIRAKLAVLEGKMALAIIDAQKIVEMKQKQIDGAHEALQLLRTTCIVWPNSASEVLFAGSFDGWTSQRKMEKSRTGIFSICLKLYPGKYEIKFITDGIWKVDPLRPIVKNNGYENNLLIIT